MSKKHNSSEPSLHNNQFDINDKYKLGRLVGRGSFGEVWLVLPTNPSSAKSHTKQYVLKRINLNQSPLKPSQHEIESAEREAQLLSTLKHPNIVTYKESFRSNDGCINIVMAYCEGGDLYTILQARKIKKEYVKENKIVEWFIQICMAIRYIHDQNILHRDLKTKNIFLTKDGIIKVGDLGIARVLTSVNDFATTMVGTPHYMSPEIFSHRPYGQKSDIWALGCCVYEMATFDQVFNADHIDSLKIKIIIAQTPQIPKMYSDSLIGIVTSMLRKEPDDRPTAKEILQDPYMKQHIERFLEKTQAKGQNIHHSKSQPVVTATPVSSASASSLPASTTNPSSSKNRLSNNNTPVLASHTALPPSHSRPSSSMHDNRSVPFPEPVMNDSRSPRLRAHRDSSLPMSDQDINLHFVSKVIQNDTLQLRKRDHQSDNHSRQDPSSDNALQPHTGSNASARERRRANRLHSSHEDSPPNISPNQSMHNYELPRATSQDNLISEIEKKKEGERDMNDLVDMLTSTLRLTPSRALHSNERTHSSNQAIHDNAYRTMTNPLLETNRLQKRYQLIRDDCLQDITLKKLQRVLKILENVSETHMTQKLIDELGEQLYNKYAAQIFLLQFYEDNLLIHS